ncbi:Integrase (fragment) [Candidatus Methylobacter favarea]|uniref:Integrase n=1 Tax=Candidatus Methylobacter favarea TaxID=2707345 RepID=A0A8S0Y6W9_9GAMM
MVACLAEHVESIILESAVYYILKAENQLIHRHASQAPRQISKPQVLSATAPNPLYSWDISFLATAVAGQFFYLVSFYGYR